MDAAVTSTLDFGSPSEAKVKPSKMNLLLKVLAENFDLHYDASDDTFTRVNATGSKQYYYFLNWKAADSGYQPFRSTLDCILVAITPMLQNF